MQWVTDPPSKHLLLLSQGVGLSEFVNVKLSKSEKYKCPAFKVKSGGVVAAGSRGCLQFEKFSRCKKSPGERRSPYVDVGKPPTKIYRLDSWISGEMCLQRIASEMCCWVFSEMFLWNQVKTGGRLGLAMTGGNVFFDNSSIWKI